MILKPKNWSKFQHYTNRKPSWIKLHRDLLNNYEFMMLQDDSKMLAPLLWLLASEDKNGSINANIDKIAFRLRIDSERLRKSVVELIDADFFEADAEFMGVLGLKNTSSEENASKVVQSAIPEREEEKEKEKEIILSENNSDVIIISESEQIANYLYQKILGENPGHKKPNLKRWSEDIGRAIRIDKRTKDELIGCIDWMYSSKDIFWRKHILSGEKLRQKFDQMRIAATTVKKSLKNGTTDDIASMTGSNNIFNKLQEITG